jgi:hypothetical protein
MPENAKKKVFSLQGFDVSHYRKTEAYTGAIDALYNTAIKEFANLAIKAKVDPDKHFSFSDYPTTKKVAQNIINNLAANMKTVIMQGSREQWLYACKKNDEFLNHILNTSKVDKKVLAKYQDRNLDALDVFQKRKVNGMDLSKRIWNYADQMKVTMEMGIDVGLGEGKSAQELSRDLRNNLVDPDKLFRRVRDKRGMLHLSKNAAAFHPGQGKYRSSYKNAMRLTRSEINMAYRESDQLRWQKLDFVVGYEIKLSNNHTTLINGVPTPFEDICDELAGRYPKTFMFKGWHPQCRCYVVPILMSDDEFDTQELNKLKAAFKKTEYKAFESKNTVKNVPQNFKNWVDANAERSLGWKSQPYFIKDNFKCGVIEGGLKFVKPVISEPIQQKTVIEKEVKPIIKQKISPRDEFIDKIDSYTSIKQIKAATEIEMQRLGKNVKITMTDSQISIETAKAFSKRITELTSDYNVETPIVAFTTTQHKSNYGVVTAVDINGKRIRYMRDFYGKSINVGQKYDSSRLNSKTTNKSLCDAENIPVSTLTHEFAHLIYTEINKSPIAESFKLELRDLRSSYYKELNDLSSKGLDYSDIYLGKYASTNMHEFMAEAFQEYKNKKSPSKYAKLVGEIVDKYYLKLK